MILMKNFDQIIPEGRTATLNGKEYTIKKVPARITLELIKMSDKKMDNAEWMEIMIDKTVFVLNKEGYHLITKEALLDEAEVDQLTQFCTFILWGEKQEKNEPKGTTP